jgi:hypothetical protein
MFASNREEKVQNQTTASAPGSALEQVRDFLISAGMDLKPEKDILQAGSENPSSLAGRGFFYNDRIGMLMVKGTLSELDSLESAVRNANEPPRLIELTIRILDICLQPEYEKFTMPMIYQTNAGSIVTFTGIMTDQQFRQAYSALSGKPATEISAAPAAAAFPGEFGVPPRSKESPNDPDHRPFVPGMSGILSPEQSDLLVRRAQAQEGINILTLAPVQMLSGQGVKLSEEGIELYARATPDGRLIQLRAKHSLTRTNESGAREVVFMGDATHKLWSGQTLALCGRDLVPPAKRSPEVLTDVPLVGRLFRKPGADTEAPRQVLLLVTPESLDDSGNVMNFSAGAFDRNSIPPQ